MALRERITDSRRLGAWTGQIGLSFRYTAGAAAERFFRTLRERGTLTATRCPECGTTYLPPRLYCPKDFQDLSDRWLELPPRGELETFTVLHQDLDGRPLPRPVVMGFIRIESTDGGLLAPIQGRPDRLKIGQRLQGVLRPRRKRRGEIAELVGFR